MIPSEPQKYLHSFINYELTLDTASSKEFKLGRMAHLLNALGRPQDDLKIIHVAGSKGKGSACVMMAHILKEAGYSVGLYTSPHIHQQRERIRILGRSQRKDLNGDLFNDMITSDELTALIDQYKPVIDAQRDNEQWGRLSFFEVFTALALCYFKNQKVDAVILETGLGGRLDATNAAASIMAVLTPISLEHTHILGNTLEEIAREKAAIIKESFQKVIIGPQEKKVDDVFINRCRDFNIKPVHSSEKVKVRPVQQADSGQVVNISTDNGNIKDVQLLLAGEHQRDNCSLAVCACEELNGLGFQINTLAIRNGVERVFWPLRLETISRRPHIVLDGAHNMKSIELLMTAVQSIRGLKPLKIIYGTSRDKEYDSIILKLKEYTDDVLFVKADHPRAEALPGSVSVEQALESIWDEEGSIILVTGSMFVAAQARQCIVERQLCIN